jgi:hypothetical protein
VSYGLRSSFFRANYSNQNYALEFRHALIPLVSAGADIEDVEIMFWYIDFHFLPKHKEYFLIELRL